jgi:hypothetical protein
MRAMLGDILVRMGCLDDEQLTVALSAHRERGVPLGRVLLQEHLCSEQELMRALAHQSGVDLTEVELSAVDRSLLSLIPQRIARYHRVVPLSREGKDTLHVAIAAPVSAEALEEVREVAGVRKVAPKIASDEAIARALVTFYGPSQVDALGAQNASVLLYGWPQVMLNTLQTQLQGRGIFGKSATPLEVAASGPSDVVLAPRLSLEDLLPSGSKLSCNLILEGEASEADLEYARGVGARGFVTSAMDTELLVRAIRRFLPATA